MTALQALALVRPPDHAGTSCGESCAVCKALVLIETVIVRETRCGSCHGLGKCFAWTGRAWEISSCGLCGGTGAA